jgi:hypothetical protein
MVKEVPPEKVITPVKTGFYLLPLFEMFQHRPFFNGVRR